MNTNIDIDMGTDKDMDMDTDLVTGGSHAQTWAQIWTRTRIWTGGHEHGYRLLCVILRVGFAMSV